MQFEKYLETIGMTHKQSKFDGRKSDDLQYDA